MSTTEAQNLRNLTGKTIRTITTKPYDSGFDGAMQQIELRFTDGTAVTLYADHYCIPEESCIYAEVSE